MPAEVIGAVVVLAAWALVEGLRYLAKKTKNTVDDAVVDLIDRALADPAKRVKLEEFLKGLL